MKLKSINFGEILAWTLSVIFYFTGVFDFSTFALFALIKLTLKVSWE